MRRIFIIGLLLLPLKVMAIPGDLKDICYDMVTQALPSKEHIGKEKIVIYKNGMKCTQSWPDGNPIKSEQDYNRFLNGAVSECSQEVENEINLRGVDAVRAEMQEAQMLLSQFMSVFNCEADSLEGISNMLSPTEPSTADPWGSTDSTPPSNNFNSSPPPDSNFQGL